MNRKDIPNLISVTRIGLTVPYVWAIMSQQFNLALLIFFVAGVSDGVDGFLAKHYHWESRLGSILDPIADKILLIAGFTCLTLMGIFPYWLLILVIVRDLIIVVGAIAYHIIFGQYDFKPLWSSKVNTTMQIVLVVFAMIQQHWLPEMVQFLLIGIYLVVLTTLISGAQYVYLWGKQAWKQNKIK